MLRLLDAWHNFAFPTGMIYSGAMCNAQQRFDVSSCTFAPVKVSRAQHEKRHAAIRLLLYNSNSLDRQCHLVPFQRRLKISQEMTCNTPWCGGQHVWDDVPWTGHRHPGWNNSCCHAPVLWIERRSLILCELYHLCQHGCMQLEVPVWVHPPHRMSPPSLYESHMLPVWVPYAPRMSPPSSSPRLGTGLQPPGRAAGLTYFGCARDHFRKKHQAEKRHLIAVVGRDVA